MKRADVYQALKSVIDPELGVNIVDLGLIYKVEVRKVQKVQKVRIIMTLTTPGCPLAGVFDMMVREAVASLPGVEADEIEIQLTFDPPWTAEMMSKEAKAELGFN